jgi:hypothetical protein
MFRFSSHCFKRLMTPFPVVSLHFFASAEQIGMAEGPSKDGACVFALVHQIRREMIQHATTLYHKGGPSSLTTYNHIIPHLSSSIHTPWVWRMLKDNPLPPMRLGRAPLDPRLSVQAQHAHQCLDIASVPWLSPLIYGYIIDIREKHERHDENHDQGISESWWESWNHEEITLPMKRHEPRFRIFLRICMFDKCHIVVFDSTNHVPVLMPTLEQTQLRNKRYFLLLFPQTWLQ